MKRPVESPLTYAAERHVQYIDRLEPQSECHLYKYIICYIIFTADMTYKLLTRGAENLLDLLRWELRKLFGHDWVSKSALNCGTEERNRLSDLWHVIQNDRFQTGVGASECASEHQEIHLEVRASAGPPLLDVDLCLARCQDMWYYRMTEQWRQLGVSYHEPQWKVLHQSLVPTDTKRTCIE